MCTWKICWWKKCRQINQNEMLGSDAAPHDNEIGGFEMRKSDRVCDPMTMGMLRMMAVFAQMERDITIQRIKSGMDNARAKGKHIGRNKTTADDIPSVFFRYYPQYAKGNINLSEFARLASLSRNSVYKYLKIVDVNSPL